MEHGRIYYESVVRVIDYIMEGNQTVSLDMGEKLAGRYWVSIVRFFKDHDAACPMMGGSIAVFNTRLLNPIYEDCLNHLKRIDEEEYDRNLSHEESICNIKYDRKGFRISIAAIIISTAAILLELAKWIWPRL